MTTRPADMRSVERDADLAEQAKPGHGVPSQDPDPAAQQAIKPDEAERERGSVYVGGGIVAGAVAGAAAGTVVGGPVGTVVGGAVGAVAGATGGAVAGAIGAAGADSIDEEIDEEEAKRKAAP